MVETPLAKSDAILVLALNEARLYHGWQLYDAGWSDTLLVSVGQHLFYDRFGYGVDIPEWAKQRVISHGVPADQLLFLWRATSTYDEATAARDTAILRGWSSIIVVTDPPHLRRTSFIFNRVFESSGVNLRFRAVPTTVTWTNLEQWWTRESSLFMVLQEYIKLLYYWWTY